MSAQPDIAPTELKPIFPGDSINVSPLRGELSVPG